MRLELTQANMVRLFDYNPASGVLVWKRREDVRKGWNTRYAGKVAGCRGVRGYLVVGVDSKLYPCHRIIFLMVYGYLPREIDHINGIGADNRLSNLRAADHAANMRNQKTRNDNTSGRVGVVWHKAMLKWQAQIGVNGRNRHLGRFDAFDTACAVRAAAEIEYGFHPNHGRPV